MTRYRSLFHADKSVIGMIHLLPLLGYIDFQGIAKTLRSASNDLTALQESGVDAVMIENNYDVPHTIFVKPETIACMTYIVKEIIDKTTLPVGVCVLWNDYKAALAIAKVCGAQFVRVPVFVDDVMTHYGDVVGNANAVIDYRKKIQADDILLFTDIHVKHARLLSAKSLGQSAKEAIQHGSDSLIITGAWTADAPEISDMQNVRKTVGDFPILIGSGATKENIRNLMQYADGVIVGTSVKEGLIKNHEVNKKSYDQRIDKERVKEFVKEFRNIL